MPLQQEEARIPPQFLPLSIARAVWKRKLWVLLIWAIVSAVTFVVVMRLPAVYQAESLILIEGQRIPERYVPATVNDELTNRLSMLTQQIKSYTSLVEMIERFDLYPEAGRTQAEEEIVARMREDIEVKIVTGWSRETIPAFTISYQGSNPLKVKQVADALTSKFRDENLEMRGEQARGTSQFLDSQLQEARVDLEKQEAQMKEFRLRYNGELPSQSSALLAKLSRLELQLKGIQDSTRNTEQQRTLLENSLANARSSLTSARELASQAAVSGGESPVRSGSRQPTELEKTEALLNNLRLRYSDDHPDVVRTATLLERLRQMESEQQAGLQAAQAELTDEAEGETQQVSLSLVNMISEHENRVRSLQIQLQLLAEDLTALEKQRDSVLAEINSTQKRVEVLPLREQELARVVRDYDMSRRNYQSLLDKKMEADVAGKMETLEKAERLVVLDMPRVPTQPIKPKRQVLISMGCMGGLALGMLLGFAIELRRGVILGEWELPEGMTVLGRVPPVKLAVAKKQERFAPKEPKSSRWRKPRVTLRVRHPGKQMVTPVIVLGVLGLLLATSIYSGWSPF